MIKEPSHYQSEAWNEGRHGNKYFASISLGTLLTSGSKGTLVAQVRHVDLTSWEQRKVKR